MKSCSDLAGLYLRHKEFSGPRARDAQERSLRQPLSRFGARQPKKISPDRMVEYVAERRAAGVKDSTIKRELGAFEAMLRFAARMRRIGETEIPVIPRLRDNARRLVYLEADQRRLLEERLASAPEDIKAFGMIGLVFGARAGAILDLTADRIGKMVDFRIPGAPQSRKRRSHNLAPPSMRSLLSALLLASEGPGARVLPADAAQRFTRWCAQQDWPEGFPRVTPHVLRHTCATLMLEKGASLWDVSCWLNETQQTVEGHYGHFTTAAQNRLAALAES